MESLLPAPLCTRLPRLFSDMDEFISKLVSELSAQGFVFQPVAVRGTDLPLHIKHRHFAELQGERST